MCEGAIQLFGRRCSICGRNNLRINNKTGVCSNCQNKRAVELMREKKK